LLKQVIKNFSIVSFDQKMYGRDEL